MADWFKRTKAVDPDVKRYINDYNILGNGGVNVNHQNGYFDIIKYIDEQGGEIQGIGMQGHFAELVTGIPKVFEILDRFSAFNKEIKITEFDINSINDELKVNYTRDFMTALFSYPMVKSFLFWGFWEGRHWKPEAALYNQDWTIRPQGEKYKELVFNEWWTPEQIQNSDATGNIGFGSCFLGTYEIEIEHGSNTILKSVPVHFNLDNEITINVDDLSVTAEGTQHTDTPVFTSAKSYKEENSSIMKLYPNPASGILNIELQGQKPGKSLVTVSDITGNTIMYRQMNLFFEKALHLPQLNPGMYFLSVKSGNQLFQDKFTVQ
jgi:hypothetical protein